MKNTIKIISILILLIFSCNVYSQSLKLTIELEKNRYLKFESIYGIVKLKNVSTTTQKISKQFYLNSHILKLKCVGKDGKTYSGYPLSSSIIKPTASYELSPNDSLMETFNLLVCFGEKDEDNPHSFYLPADEYALTASFMPEYSYKTQDIKKLNTIYSENLTFFIESPRKNMEEFKVYKNIIKAINDRNSNYKKQSSRKRNNIKRAFINELKNIIRSYPKNNYIDIAFTYVLMYDFMNKDIVLKAIDSYHNSYFAADNLTGILIGDYRKYDGFYLNYIKEYYPNSFVKNYFDYFVAQHNIPINDN